jgi:hypothetical protein
MLENTEGAFINGQSRETGNIGHTRRRKTQHNMYWIPLNANKHKQGKLPQNACNKMSFAEKSMCFLY